MPLSLLIGVLTLVPALAAILIAGTGAARRALAPAVFVLCALGTLVPVVGLLMLVPYLGSGEPLRVAFFGGSLATGAWFSAVYRIDAFGVYASLGLAVLVVPLLLWMAWKGRLTPALSEVPGQPENENAEAGVASGVASQGETGTEATADDSETPIARSMLPVRGWAGVALTLGAESAALTVLFADNILWLALAWLVLAALVWGTGELGAEDIDRAGLALILAGPLLWAVVMLTGAVPAKAATLFDLMGRGAYSVIQVILLGLVLALAGGAYPFLTWVRRRAALATPAGLGALMLILLPVALFAAARTYAAATDINGQWAEIGQAAPPVYGGIAWAVLGAVTVGICGLLALERRDNRTLLAYLGSAQIGWGMLALSTGDPASLPGIILLLAGAIFGLGAMLAAIFAGATLTDDEELDGAGPRAFGARFSSTGLFAWCVGGVSLIGVPLFGGFAARELISAAALHLGNLTVPLIGIAWAGDALLGLALLRATAPAFTQLVFEHDVADDTADDDANETLAVVAAGETPGDEEDEDELTDDADAETDEADLEAERKAHEGTRTGLPTDIRALPALIFALLAAVLGIAPQVLLAFGGTLAAGILAPAHAVDQALRSTDVGYATGFGQWLPSLAWGAVVVLALVFTFTRPDSLRTARLPRADAQAADETASPELASLPEPTETWRDLGPIFASSVALPAGKWLLANTEMETVEPAEVEPAETATSEASEVTESTKEPPEPVDVAVPAAATRAAEGEAAASTPVRDVGDVGDDGDDSNDSNDSPPPASQVVAPTGDSSDAGETNASSEAAKPERIAAPSGVETATSRPATPTAKPTTPATKPTAPAAKAAATAQTTDGAGTKPAAQTGGKPAAKSSPPATGARQNTPAKPTTKPAASKLSGQTPAKGGKSGGKKQPGGRP